MYRTTELVLMIVGGAALVVAAILLPALLLTPSVKVEQMARAPAAPQAELPKLAESAGFPPVAQLSDPPLSHASETNRPTGQTAASLSESTQPAEPAESTSAVDPTPRQAAKPADEAAKSSHEVAVAAVNEPKGVAQNERTIAPLAAPPAGVPNDSTTPPDQIAMVPLSEPVPATTPHEPAAATMPSSDRGVEPAEPGAVPSEPKDVASSSEPATVAANVPSSDVKPLDRIAMPSEPVPAVTPHEPAAATTPSSDRGVESAEPGAVPSEPKDVAAADLRMPTVETLPPSDMGAVPAGESAAKVAALRSDEPAATDRTTDEESTSPLPARRSGRVRTPRWCANPSGEDVATVCANRELLVLDAELNALYTNLMARGPNPELRNAQRQWLVERQSCGADITCLKRHYEKRIDELARM